MQIKKKKNDAAIHAHWCTHALFWGVFFKMYFNKAVRIRIEIRLVLTSYVYLRLCAYFSITEQSEAGLFIQERKSADLCLWSSIGEKFIDGVFDIHSNRTEVLPLATNILNSIYSSTVVKGRYQMKAWVYVCSKKKIFKLKSTTYKKKFQGPRISPSCPLNKEHKMKYYEISIPNRHWCEWAFYNFTQIKWKTLWAFEMNSRSRVIDFLKSWACLNKRFLIDPTGQLVKAKCKSSRCLFFFFSYCFSCKTLTAELVSLGSVGMGFSFFLLPLLPSGSRGWSDWLTAAPN